MTHTKASSQWCFGWRTTEDAEQTYQCSQVVPHLGDVRVEAYGAGVCIKCISVLVDLVVQNANRAPECRVPPIAINGLLIGLIRLGILLL